MRAARALLSLSLGSAACAQHHHHRHIPPIHRHHPAHGGSLRARQASLEGQTVTIIDNSQMKSTNIPEIVIFVDGNSVPVSSATAVAALVPPTDAPVAGDVVQNSLSSLESVDAPSQSEDHAARRDTPGASTLSARRSKKTKGHGGAGASSKATGSGLYGVAYAPYNADGSCKSARQIMDDFGVIGPTYGYVRVYGVDCNQIPHVYAAAKANQLRVMYGLFSLDNLGDQVATLTEGIQSDWSHVETVSVGNELVNNGQATPKQIQDALTATRQLLAAAGYAGPVVTVDTFVAALAHPELCSSSDYCAVNIHPFFDPNTRADQAGTFVLNMVQALRKKLGNPSARVRVTESGWPWQGSANGKAVPGIDQQAAAISSIRSAFASNPEDVFLFSMFNDRWKTAAQATFYAEQFWGIGTADAPSA